MTWAYRFAILKNVYVIIPAEETQQLLGKMFKSSDEVSLGINELKKLSEDLTKQSEMLNEIKEKILSRAEVIAGLATMD